MGMVYFCAYHSALDAMEPLNDAERGRLFTACLIYSKTGVSQELRGNERFIFHSMKAQIDRDIESYKGKCSKNRKNVCEYHERMRTNTNEYERNDGVQTSTTATSEHERSEPKRNKAAGGIEGIPYEKIIKHLNNRAGTQYKHTSKKTIALIKARFSDGFSMDDFIRVIDGRIDKWKDDERFSEYIRPETLFGTKFESYLNSAAVRPSDEEDSLLKKALKKRAVQIMVV